MDTSSTTQMAQIMGYHWRSSWTKSVPSPTCRTLAEETIWKSCIGTRMGKKYRTGNVYVFIEHKDWFSSEYVDNIKNERKSRIQVPCGRNCWSWLIWENQLRFLTTRIGDALNVNANRTKSLLMNTETCLNHELLQELRISWVGETSRKNSRVVIRNGRTCSKMLWFRTGEQKRQGSCTQFQALAWMIINSRWRSVN